MVFCHSCGQGVEADWNACPFCSSPLIAPTPEVEVESPVYPSPVQNYDEYESPVENYDEYESPVQPSTEYGRGMSQPESPAPIYQPQYQVPQIPAQQIQVPQYHQTPQTQYLTTQRGGGGGGKVVIIIAVVIGVMVLLSILLYAWASALAGKDTWSGSVDTRIPDVKWYDYDGYWEMWSSDGQITGSYPEDEFTDYDSLEAYCSNGYCTYTVENWYLEGDYYDVTMESRETVVGDVWFTLFTDMYFDGEWMDMDDGECFAVVHDDAYYSTYSWRQEVSQTNWPSYCDSVDEY
ncbi:MAG: hypothetical protein QGG96_00740 [Candidatus Poseidoniaceae archaeon]|nr:hypothetical protein [Candidatus Poseidoniaceae archaeon]